MNFSVPSIQTLIDEAEKLESPWKERVLALANDWLEWCKDSLTETQKGVELAKTLTLGGKAVAQLDAIEELLRLPICQPCRNLIAGDHFSGKI